MTPDEREHVDLLCEQIAKEQNHERFTELVRALHDLLEGKNLRVENDSTIQANSESN